MAKRRGSQFTVDAESVQGIPGATVTFRALTVGEWREYRTTELTDVDLIRAHLLTWTGIVDDDDNELPSPADEPEVLDALYLHEQQALARLLWQGPMGDSAKN